MSPRSIRRYRAERLLSGEFERLRAHVIERVASRLRARGVSLDASDLDACYGIAWQALYAAVLEGTQVEDPAAWLALVAYRRAIDEHRARRSSMPRARVGGCEAHGGEPSSAAVHGGAAASARDLADELDDRERLRQLFEALRGRLSAREREAATLCYLQGLSRAEAAARMGVSESRMRKLMEGRGRGAPGVAGKVGGLVRAIGDGAWCEQQGSLMRGLAYGILDPAGERYRLALAHSDQCPACRAYVRSLRGLAAVLPPVPALLQWLRAGAGGASLAAARAAAHAGGATGSAAGPSSATAPAGSAAAAAPGAGAAGGVGGAGAGAGALASGAAGAGAGAAGGGWWLAGPLSAKLAVGCLVALGVGAGCVALGGQPHHARVAGHGRRERAARVARASDDSASAPAGATPVLPARPSPDAADLVRAGGAPARVAAAQQAPREFGPEQPASPGRSGDAGQGASVLARAASAARTSSGANVSSAASGSSTSAAGDGSATTPAAEREFSPG